MTAMTEALEVVSVAENLPVALVVNDVVHVCRADPSPVPGALTAERLAQELRWPQVELPLVGLVHPAPGLRFLTAPIAERPMGVAVTIAHQHAAAGMPAGSERL